MVANGFSLHKASYKIAFVIHLLKGTASSTSEARLLLRCCHPPSWNLFPPFVGYLIIMHSTVRDWWKRVHTQGQKRKPKKRRKTPKRNPTETMFTSLPTWNPINTLKKEPMLFASRFMLFVLTENIFQTLEGNGHSLIPGLRPHSYLCNNHRLSSKGTCHYFQMSISFSLIFHLIKVVFTMSLCMPVCIWGGGGAR